MYIWLEICVDIHLLIGVNLSKQSYVQLDFLEGRGDYDDEYLVTIPGKH
jgi:hypothetical protein